MIGFIHIGWVYVVYIMSSCLRCYSVCHELNTIDASRSRSIGGVIVVDVGRSRSTCLRRDAYIHDHCLDYCHNYVFFYQLPNSNLFTHRMLSSREKPLVKTMAPGSTFIIYNNTKIPCCNFLFSFILSLQFIYLPLQDLILASNCQGDWQPSCFHWVQVFAFRVSRCCQRGCVCFAYWIDNLGS